jgi:hypothetical protein
MYNIYKKVKVMCNCNSDNKIGCKCVSIEDADKLYSDIELLVIKWNNDGTRTAGSLVREIMSLLDINDLEKR